MPTNTRTASPRRVAANRANAARSTGPRSPQGKARSAQNSRKHGFAAANFAVIRLEELDAVERLTADLISVYQPVNSQELFAVERIALAQQALLRCATLEAGMFSSLMNESFSRPGVMPNAPAEDLTRGIEVATAQNRAYALAEGLQYNARRSNSFSLFLRYQAQTERLYRRAVEEFERLKALRPQLPNEPIAEPQLQQTAGLAPLQTKPPAQWNTPPAPSPSTTPAPRALEPRFETGPRASRPGGMVA